jgi:hypothetical protein
MKKRSLYRKVRGWILCRLGHHKWKPGHVMALPNRRCIRCGKVDGYYH